MAGKAGRATRRSSWRTSRGSRTVTASPGYFRSPPQLRLGLLDLSTLVAIGDGLGHRFGVSRLEVGLALLGVSIGDGLGSGTFGVELCAEQQGDIADPQPDEEGNDSAE